MRAGVIQGIIGRAGVTALLAVCLCLIFFKVKTHSRKAVKTAVGMDDIHPAVGSASLVHQHESESESSADLTSSAGIASTLEMEQELHYASLSFNRMNPQEGTYRTQGRTSQSFRQIRH
uniref:Uncharacterized protein n=1 Tax=Equus caballus TaxID=9796 RepID=A0A3Q2LAE1_HORSE